LRGQLARRVRRAGTGRPTPARTHGVPSPTQQPHGWAVRYARPDEAERIAAEIDRRRPAPDPVLPPAAAEHGLAGQLSETETADDVLASLPPPDDWGWLAVDPGEDRFAGMTATERWTAEREEAQQARRTAYTRAQIREMYREHSYRQWLAAENYCRGNLVNRRAEAEGVDPESLFSGPAHVAYARASEDLIRYWAEVEPRITLAEYTEQLTGVRTAEAERARHSRDDQQNRQ
jgi:hypothetical protein